jgi:hypothetical protein
MFKTPEDFAQAAKAFIPQVNFNKNGYEIRTKILEMAKDHVWNDYHSKFGAWTIAVEKKDEDLVTKIEYPEIPGADKILEAAEKFYGFVNQSGSKK